MPRMLKRLERRNIGVRALVRIAVRRAETRRFGISSSRWDPRGKEWKERWRAHSMTEPSLGHAQRSLLLLESA
jgi:hypothetical protein